MPRFRDILTQSSTAPTLRNRIYATLRSTKQHLGGTSQSERVRLELVPKLNERFHEAKGVIVDCPSTCGCGLRHCELFTGRASADSTWTCTHCGTENGISYLIDDHPYAHVACQKCKVVDLAAASLAELFVIFKMDDEVPAKAMGIDGIFGLICTSCGLSWKTNFEEVDGSAKLVFREARCACGDRPWIGGELKWAIFCNNGYLKCPSYDDWGSPILGSKIMRKVERELVEDMMSGAQIRKAMEVNKWTVADLEEYIITFSGYRHPQMIFQYH